MEHQKKPLSDLGLLSYRRYWSEAIMEALLKYRPTDGESEYPSLSIKFVEKKNSRFSFDLFVFAFFSLSDLSDITAIQKEDVLAALQNLNIIRYQQGSYVLSITKELFDNYQDKRRLRVDQQSLSWTPKISAKPSNSFQTR